MKVFFIVLPHGGFLGPPAFPPVFPDFRDSPGDMERLPAALPVAGHAGSAGRLALPPMVLADVTRLDSRAEAGTRTRQSSLSLWSPAAAAGANAS